MVMLGGCSLNNLSRGLMQGKENVELGGMRSYRRGKVNDFLEGF